MMIRPLIENGRLLSLLAAVVVVAGLGALSVLPIAEDPAMANRFALVLTPFPGASASRVESLVTEKIELRLRELPEIKEISSSSGNGMSSISVSLIDEVTDPEPVWSRARDLIDEVSQELPAGTQPTQLLDKRGFAYTMLIALKPAAGHDVQRQILQRYARELQSLLRAHPGTDVVEIDGEVREEIQVRVDSARAAAAGQTVSSISRALSQYDTKATAGLLENTQSRLQVEISGDLSSVERVSRVPVGVGAGARVLRVGDLAVVERAIRQPDTEKSLRRGQEQLVVAIRMLSTERIASWQQGVLNILETYDANLPGNLQTDIIFDQLEYTDQRMQHLTGNIAIGFALILLILLVTLGWRSALIVSAALPLMTLFTFFLMNMFNVPIHQMSVTGLVVALGITVDNAIVMVDDIAQRRRRGDSVLTAAEGAVQHLWLPLFGSTATTILAFMPIVLMPGGGGDFVGPLAVCVVFALIGSYLISFTLVAAVAAKLVTPQRGKGWWRDGLSLPGATRSFESLLGKALAKPRTTIALVMMLPTLGFWGITTVPEQFFPPVDRDMFTIEVTLPMRASFDRTETLVREIDEYLAQTHGVVSVDWFIGKSAASFYYNLIEKKYGAQNYAQAMVRANSDRDTERLVTSLQAELPSRFAAAQIVIRKLEQGPPVDLPVAVRLYGPDLEVLEQLGSEFRLMLSTLPGVTNTTASLGQIIPSISFSMREEVIAGSRLTPVLSADSLRASLDGIVVGALLEDTEEVPVRVRLARSERRTAADLQSLNLIFSGGNASYNATALQSIADMTIKPSVISIPHHNGRRVNTVGAYIRAGVLADTVATDLQALMKQQQYALPAGYSMEYAGELAERSDAIGALAAKIPLIMLLLIVVLVLSFNSWRLCGLILLVALLAVGLGMLSLTVSGYAFGFQVIIALLGLMGLAINGAIVILAEMRATPAARSGDIDGIINAVMHCTRHILSTTITTVAGFMPLMIGGGLFWPPFATAIVGGTVLVTLLSLLLVPCAFLLLSRRDMRRASRINPEVAPTNTLAA